jgi:hypothetical protein
MYHTIHLTVSRDQINSTRSKIGFTEGCDGIGVEVASGPFSVEDCGEEEVAVAGGEVTENCDAVVEA